MTKKILIVDRSMNRSIADGHAQVNLIANDCLRDSTVGMLGKSQKQEQEEITLPSFISTQAKEIIRNGIISS